MKKTYIKPITTMVEVEMQSLIMASDPARGFKGFEGDPSSGGDTGTTEFIEEDATDRALSRRRVTVWDDEDEEDY